MPERGTGQTQTGAPPPREPSVGPRKILRAWPDVAWTLVLFVFLVLQVSPLVNRVTEDEALLVYDAHRVSQGQVPYRDFFGLWAPGGYYAFSGGPAGWWGHPETGCRYLQIAGVLIFTLLLACALKGLGRWRWPAAAVLPVAILPLWPFMGNHWFAAMACAGVAFALEGRTGPPSPWTWIALGALVSLSGWFLQTEGLLALLMALLILFETRTRGGLGRRAALAAVGALAAGGVLLAPLVWAGGLGGMVRDAILWPLANYRKPGNVADVPLLDGLAERLFALSTRPPGVGAALWGVEVLAGWILHGLLLLGVAGLVGASLWHLGRILAGRASASPKTAPAILTPVAFLLFWRVNPAWVALLYTFFPVAVLWGRVVSHDGPMRWRRWYGPVLCLLLACGLLYNGRAYLARSHAAWEYFDVDRVDRESPLNHFLRELPFMNAGDTIVVLPSGGNNYLYTYPAGVGYTQLFVLELEHHTVEDHRRAAEEIARARPKVILFHAISEASFMAPEDPLSGAVGKGYIRWRATPAVVAYLRRDVVPPEGASARRPSEVPAADPREGAK